MKSVLSCRGILSLLAMAFLGAVLIGCSQPAQKSADKKKEPAKKTETEQKAKPKPEEPKVKPEEPTAKPEEPKTKPEEPKVKPEEPATKPEEPKVKPEEPKAKPAAPPAAGDAPKVSAFAPAADLENQVAAYLKEFGKTVVDDESYKDGGEYLPLYANAFAVVSLALGLHDQENKYKAHAAAMIKGAQEVAATKDLAAAKKAVENLQAAADGKGQQGGDLKWEKVADLPQLMKAVPLINTKLKRMAQGTRFKSRAKDSGGHSAVLAAVAQASIADASPAKNDEQIGQWKQFCVDMRAQAGAANAAIRAGDQAACDAAMEKLTKACDDCHVIFHPAAIGKTGEEKEK